MFKLLNNNLIDSLFDLLRNSSFKNYKMMKKMKFRGCNKLIYNRLTIKKLHLELFT
jgi:hypothetical protein